MDRREFFKSALRRGAKTVVDHAEEQVNQQAKRWIRPPHAINELDFLLSCSRCGDCITACPHDVVFALPARVGAKVAGTPALDLLNKGCHLCEEWPCVQACDETALSVPAQGEDNSPPRLATASINTATCLPYKGPECGACEGSCPVPGALTWHLTRPVIDEAACVGCGLCRQACIVEPAAVEIRSARLSTTT